MLCRNWKISMIKIERRQEWTHNVILVNSQLRVHQSDGWSFRGDNQFVFILKVYIFLFSYLFFLCAQHVCSLSCQGTRVKVKRQHESFPTFHRVRPREQTQFIKLGSKCLYQPSRLAPRKDSFFPSNFKNKNTHNCLKSLWSFWKVVNKKH